MRDAEDRRLSVRPIPDIAYFHRIKDFGIDLRNHGLGPMLVSEVAFVQPDGTVTARLFPKSHFSATGPLATVFDPVFMVRIDTVSTIAAGEEINLARYDYKAQQTRNFAACLEELATGIVIRVRYTDIYGSAFMPFTYEIPSGTQTC
ncbi:MAG: hypothetical protein AAGM84_10635 [Pseudomonadota bacterium]